MYFKTKELVAMALFGAIIFAIAFVLGTAILAVTGIPATGGLANVLVGVLLLVIGVKTINKFGVGTIIMTIEGALSVPTLINGTPGVHKIFLMLLMGLIFDIIVVMFKRTKKGFILGATLGTLVLPWAMYYAMVLMGLPGPEKLQPILIPISLAYAVLGAVGAWMGLILYEKKLKDKAFVKQLQS